VERYYGKSNDPTLSALGDAFIEGLISTSNYATKLKRGNLDGLIRKTAHHNLRRPKSYLMVDLAAIAVITGGLASGGSAASALRYGCGNPLLLAPRTEAVVATAARLQARLRSVLS